MSKKVNSQMYGFYQMHGNFQTITILLPLSFILIYIYIYIYDIANKNN